MRLVGSLFRRTPSSIHPRWADITTPDPSLIRHIIRKDIRRRIITLHPRWIAALDNVVLFGDRSAPLWALGKPWAFQNQQLVRLWKNMTVLAIARRLGRTRASVYYQAVRLGLPTRCGTRRLRRVVVNPSDGREYTERRNRRYDIERRRVVFKSTVLRRKKVSTQKKIGYKPCMTCRKLFWSQGIGNRMCEICHELARTMI